MPPLDLSKPPARRRGAIATGLAAAAIDAPQRVDPTGGMHGAGLIRGAAVITQGEALGHEVWIDGQFLDEIVAAINAEPQGIKARFTHPSISGDGLGTYLGRWHNATRDGATVRADLHFSPAAHATPDGDLAAYLMQLATDDPAAFGVSIVFTHDSEAETAFLQQHMVAGRGFISPDPANVDNLPHERLAQLFAADAVDTPAANPAGLFGISRRCAPAAQADQLLDYALGRGPRPTVTAFDLDPDRLRAWMARALASRNLAITEATMPPETTPPPSATPPDNPPAIETPETEETAQEPLEESTPAETSPTPTNLAARYLERWGERGAVWFAQGLTEEQAARRHEAELTSELTNLRRRNQELETQLANLRGAAAPLPLTVDPADARTAEPRGVARYVAALSAHRRN